MNKVTSHWSLCAAAVLMAASSCHAQKAEKASRTNGASASREDEIIGVATQEADGTIVLQLRTPSDSGIVGDALIRYPRDDPHYAAVARHVGPIPKGGSVFVKPFPER